ncbi:hypothetical protein AVEN_102001-1 [Araneus ventricosus]|uniref:Mutator-like transposase domain-containing protein n=1 Tax=Araneus ventricosus TaxID=182803 RepID=A0A4Y2I8H2_ARAVE|nr:hypothetical protein AVEN_102001-1 [Araneus ventricosus]
MNDKRSRRSGTRPKTNKFRGNQHSNKNVKMGKKDEKVETNPNKSSSFRKMSANESSQLPTNDSKNLIFIDISIFKDFESALCCSTCHGKINIIETTNYGFSSVFKISCESYNGEKTWKNSKMVGIKIVPTISRRAVFAMRMIGKGAKSLQTFSSCMAFPAPVSQKSYDKINDTILHATTVVANSCMKKAAEEEELLTGSSDIMVSGDGTWKTRGHSSLVGVCTVIGAEIGKVIDIDVMSSYCKSCEVSKKLYSDKSKSSYQQWQSHHAKSCQKMILDQQEEQEQFVFNEKDIWAIWMHVVSTDADPEHHFCPTGENLWCKYNQAKFKNSLEKFKHKSSVPRAVMGTRKPIFKALSNPTLLKRCLGGKTQHTNESLNSLIWNFCSKNTNSSKTIAQIACNLACINYNSGEKGILNGLKELELDTDEQLVKDSLLRYKERIKLAERCCRKATLEARKAKKRLKTAGKKLT